MELFFYSFHVAAVLLCFLPLSTSGNVRRTKAVKKGDRSFEDNVLSENGGTRKRAPFFNVLFSDNGNIDSKSDKEISKSIHKSIVSIPSTKQPPESDTSLTTLIPAFINCVQCSVEPGRFEKLTNGSVYVPELEIFLNASSYIIRYGVLYYCPEFLYPDDGVTEKTRGLESDYKASRIDSNHTVGRFRRSGDYLLMENTSVVTTDAPSSRVTDCNETRLGRSKYQKFSNGSVYVPSHNRLYNSSDYVLLRNVLVVCVNTPAENNITVSEEEKEERTTNSSSNVLDASNVTIDFTKDEGRIRRSVHYDSDNSTLSNSETTIDLSILSPEFIDCAVHISVEPGWYEKLPNGSVYVPAYNKVFDISNYIIRNEELFICSFFDTYSTGGSVIKGSVNSSRDVLDACNVTMDFTKDEGRIRRSVHYDSDNSTLSNSETTIDLSILSPEFIDCAVHIPVEPGCYEKLPNGSVYVPVYSKVFDISNYVIRNELLIICSFFDTYSTGGSVINGSVNSSSDVLDACNVTMDFMKEKGRIWRLVHYDSHNSTLPNSETTIENFILSPEFLDCAHIPVGCYEKLPNGSVYVPVYNIVSDNSNYLIRNEELILCPIFVTYGTGGSVINGSINFSWLMILLMAVLL